VTSNGTIIVERIILSLDPMAPLRYQLVKSSPGRDDLPKLDGEDLRRELLAVGKATDKSPVSRPVRIAVRL